MAEDPSSKKDLEEDYSREIEIENAFETFEQAITLQSSGQYAKAYMKYKELAKKDVIMNHYYEETEFIKGLQNGGLNTQPDELSFLSQNVKSIRFLYFRNRGFLFFNILKSGSETLLGVLAADTAVSALESSQITPAEFTKELFYSMIDDFVNCFVYQEADEALISLLHDLFVYMDLKKLARFSLEYALTMNSESDDVISILPMNQWATRVWNKFIKLGLTNDSSSDLAEKFLFLQPIKQDLQEQINRKLNRNVLEVSVKESSGWLDVLQAFNNAMKQYQDKEKVQELSRNSLTYVDPYLASDNTLDSVEYVFPGKEEETIPEIVPEVQEIPKDAIPEAPTNEQISETPTEIATEPVTATSPDDEEQLETITREITDAAVPGKAVQRSSRRLNPGEPFVFELDDIQLTRRHYVETEAFFNHLNDCFREVFETETLILQDVVCHITDCDITSSSPPYVLDFLKVLNEWNRKAHSGLLLTEKASGSGTDFKSDRDKMKLLDVLTQFGNHHVSDTETILERLDDIEDYDVIKQYLSEQLHVHVNLAKLNILHRLLGKNNRCLITETLWDPSLYQTMTDWVVQLDPEVRKIWKTERPSELSSHFFADFCLSVSIYEILVDSYIGTKARIEKWLDSSSKNAKSSRSGFNSATIKLLRIEDKLNKWNEIFQTIIFNAMVPSEIAKTHLPYIVRFMWASNYRIASKSFTWKEKKYVVMHLQELIDLLRNNEDSELLHIPLPNYDNIGEFSSESLHRRLTTASILSIFSKILYSDNSNDNSGDTIDLLENILIEKHGESDDMDIEGSLRENSLVVSVIHGRATLDKRSLQSVREFLDQCPIDLKLSLWNILFQYYEEKGSFASYQRGFEQNLDFLLKFLNSEKYLEFKGDRAKLLLNALSFYGSYLKVFLKCLSENKWKLPSEDAPNTVDVVLNLSKIFELLYCFSLHEEAALITGAKISVELRSKTAFQELKDFFIDCISIILVYGINSIDRSRREDKEDLKLSLFNLVHSQLGIRRLCDSSNGLFLKITESVLTSMPKRPDLALAQLLSCRFHYRVKIQDHFPADHYTQKTAKLDKSNALELADFVLPLCFRHNPLLKVPRNDMKQVVDDIFEVIQDPDLESDKVLLQNNASIEKFFDHTILSARFVKEAFYGLYKVTLETPKSNCTISHNGLYYLEAVFMFNSYKIRKKSAQSRTVELERIISLLKYDLIFGSHRVESWILLGQAYGFIVEDDLIWTSDKLNIIDRKVVTANLQRKSLLSYMMAINTLTQYGYTGVEHYKPVISILMNSFVKEFYSASRTPMDMIAFKVHNSSKFVRKKNQQTMFQSVSDKPTIPIKFCLKLMQKCLHLAVKSYAEEWTTFFYLGKIQAKLNKSPTEVLDTLIIASTLSRKQGTPADPLLEPAYKLCTLLYKYVKNGKLGVANALEYLTNDPTLQMVSLEPTLDKQELYKYIIAALEKLMSMDRKGWYHKPCYRMALIYYDEFDDYKKAREIISKFFSLKASNKTFLQMWKPEHERPGKHFVYMYQYTQFNIKLLRRELDLSSLIQMLPKLRRANSTMIMLYFAWENICASICKLIRVIAEIEDSFVEGFLINNTYQSFIVQAKAAVDAIKSDGIPEDIKPYVCYLYVINDMRKLNNGFGPTSLIDDTICAVFLKLFNRYQQKVSPNETIDLTKESPNGKVKKLAKRDLFPFINDLVGKCKRDVESYIKDSANFFNDYVSKYIDHKRAESCQLLRSSTSISPSAESQHLLMAPTDNGIMPLPPPPTIFITRKSSGPKKPENDQSVTPTPSQENGQSIQAIVTPTPGYLNDHFNTNSDPILITETSNTPVSVQLVEMLSSRPDSTIPLHVVDELQIASVPEIGSFPAIEIERSTVNEVSTIANVSAEETKEEETITTEIIAVEEDDKEDESKVGTTAELTEVIGADVSIDKVASVENEVHTRDCFVEGTNDKIIDNTKETPLGEKRGIEVVSENEPPAKKSK